MYPKINFFRNLFDFLYFNENYKNVKKRIIILSVILAFSGLLYFFIPVKGTGYCNLINFTTNKSSYYIDEEIEINATGILEYDNITETSFVQIQIFDNSNNKLWNSSEYSKTGNFTIHFNVNIIDLDINLLLGPVNISVRFYYYINSSGVEEFNLLDIIEITIKDNDFNRNLIKFTTDKNIYYIDEEMELNAIWEINYKILEEISYIQVQIFNNSENLIYNTSEYHDRGFMNNTWIIAFQNLNLILFNNSANISIRFFFYWFNPIIFQISEEFLGIVDVKIIKKPIICNLIEFHNRIDFGESLNLKAQFFDETNHSILLKNQEVIFKSISNKAVIFSKNFTTNDLGIISINLSTIEHLELFQNYILFSIKNNENYNDTDFLFEIYVEKAKLFIEIHEFESLINKNEDIEITASLYYYMNNTRIYLINEVIQLEIYNTNTIIYSGEYLTDKNGLLRIQISALELEITDYTKNLTIYLIFKGTSSIEYTQLSLNTIIEDFYMLNVFPFFSITMIILSLFVIIVYNNNKKTKQRYLADISIKY